MNVEKRGQARAGIPAPKWALLQVWDLSGCFEALQLPMLPVPGWQDPRLVPRFALSVLALSQDL